MNDGWLTLAKTSLRDPGRAAEDVIAMDFGREVLWTALGLVAIVNTFLVLLVIEVSGPGVPLPGYFDRPLALFILIAGLTVVYIHGMYWAGMAIGGQGRLMDVLAVTVWFQVLRAGAQVAIILLSLAIPALGALASLVVAIWGIWIFINFLARALRLSSPWHAVAVLLIAFVGLIFGLGILMALIGGFAQGVTG